MKKMSEAPAFFKGSFDELFEEHIEQNLPSSGTVSAFHAALLGYIKQPDSLFLVRAVSSTERGQTYATADKTRFRAIDNAPVWWTHYQLFHDRCFTSRDLHRAIETIPAHQFDVARTVPESANTHDWHFAHIYDVKDRHTTWFEWTRAEVVRRFVRNIHPCNSFLLPKTEWQRWGGDSRVLAFMRWQYARRYSDVWSAFVVMAGHIDDAAVRRPESFVYSIGEKTAVARAGRPAGGRQLAVDSRSPRTNAVAAEYSASRLLFKASAIEPLELDQRFRIRTPVGLFEMSKREFYEAFPRLVQTVSYRERGVYHFPKMPRAALRFLVE